MEHELAIPNPGFKVGDKVVILNDNKGYPGGVIRGYDGEEAIIHIIYNEAGYARMEHPNFVWAFQNIRHVDEEKAKAIKSVKKPKQAKPKKKKKEKQKPLSVVLKNAIGSAPNTVGYAMRFTDNPDNIQARDVCNARMHWMYDTRKTGECIEVIQDVGIKAKKVFNEEAIGAYRSYVNWFMNHSPWSQAVLTKNLGNAFKHGVKLNPDKSVHQVVAAGITLREGTEFSWKLPLFQKLLDKGYSGNVAYLVCSSLKPSGPNSYSYTGINMGHCTLSGEMDWKVLKEFFKNGYVLDKKEKPLRNSYAYRYEIFKYIAPTGGGVGSTYNTFLNILKGEKKAAGFGGEGSFSFDKALILADFLTVELHGDLK